MKLLSAKIDWYKRYNNLPVFKLLVDVMPELSELRYSCREGIYYAELDNYVHFLYYIRPGDGFGGQRYKIKLIDGSEKELKGPWSSNAAAVNGLGFGPCVDVCLTTDLESFERGWTFFAGSCKLNLVEEAVKLCKVDLVKVVSHTSKDSSGEQNHCSSLYKDLFYRFDYEVPIGVDWTVIPSLSPETLIKET